MRTSIDKSYELPDEEMKTKSESFEKGKKASDYLEKMCVGCDSVHYIYPKIDIWRDW